MKNWKGKIKLFLIDALGACIFWTLCLSPYMIFVVGIDINQYVAWVGMQVIIIPPLGGIVPYFIRWFRRRFKI